MRPSSPMTTSSTPPLHVEPVASDVLEETRTFNVGLERLLATQPSIHTVPPAVVRRVRREGRGIFPPPVYLPEARDLVIPGRSGEIRLRVVAPAGEARGAFLHIHGGGWVLGAADMQDPGLRELADATGLTAVSVDYRLAPEHPYPAGPDDCEDAARWLVERGAKELGVPDFLAIGGESAGAHLAAVTLIRLRDRHGNSGAFHAANLIFGAYDMGMTPSQRLWGDRNLVLSGPIMRFFGDAFLPGTDLEARRAPDISPLYADLRGMPPAIFSVGTLDPLLDDSLFMAARWRAAGNHAELRVWPEAIHGFNAFPLAMARAANEAQYAFLSACVAGRA
ncbi:Alpha/beta hydrolase fold-3 domain protein [Minicystis rosea]|nr:Alpha/beta hydrolase fold-3 domain protein [Minicystis rosea]